jgi:hypothetical protein
LLDLMFDPAGMRPFVEQWEAVAAGLLQRVHRETVGHVVDQKTVELLKSLEKYPGVKELPRFPKAQGPVIPIAFVKDGKRSSYFSLITTVGTPQCLRRKSCALSACFRQTPAADETFLEKITQQPRISARGIRRDM